MTSPFRPHTVTVDGGALRVLSAGEGETLVYLHGVGDIGEPLPVLERLADDYRVIRPDHPGFGESDELQIGSVADIAAVEERLLDELEIERFVLIGCSFGGWVAAELALRAADRVSRLVLIDPVGLRGSEPGVDIFTASPEEIARATTFSEARRAAAAASPPPPAIAARLARNREAAARLGRETRMTDPGLAARLGALSVDTLLVWGAEDGLVPPSYAQEWLAAIPGSRAEIIADAGHLPQLEQPEAFLEASGLLQKVAG